MTLTTREAATALWLLILLLFVLWKSGEARRSIASAFEMLLRPKLLVPLVLYVAWMIPVVWFACRVGLWTPPMLKDTLFWTVPGLALWVGAAAAASKPRFFRGRLRAIVGLSILIVYYVNLATFDVIIEIVLQFIVAVLVVTSAFGEHRTELRSGKAVADRLLAVIGLLLLIYAGIVVANSWATADRVQLLRDLALPVWLTLGALPFVYVLSLYATYEMAYLHMKIATPTGDVPLHAMLAMGRAFHVRSGPVHEFAGKWPRELALSKSFREAHEVIRAQQASLLENESAERKRADDLVRYTGVDGMDAAGRRLDRREFEETIDSLDTLSTSHMGWYRGRGRYQANLLERFAEVYARRLPAEHGIQMKVSKSGQAWYGWRRTPSGWYFGIGAAGPPPDQRFYDGSEPPGGYPGRVPGWSDAFERGVNWEGLDV